MNATLSPSRQRCTYFSSMQANKAAVFILAAEKKNYYGSNKL